MPDALEQPGAQVTVAQIIDGLKSSLNQTLLAFSGLALLALVVAAWAVHGHPEWMSRRSGDAS